MHTETLHPIAQIATDCLLEPEVEGDPDRDTKLEGLQQALQALMRSAELPHAVRSILAVAVTAQEDLDAPDLARDLLAVAETAAPELERRQAAHERHRKEECARRLARTETAPTELRERPPSNASGITIADVFRPGAITGR